MSFLRRAFGGGEPAVPDWASFFSAGEYRAFLEAVGSDLRRRGLAFEMGDGVVRIDQGGDGEPTQFGLSNLSQLCHADDQDRWPTLIATHFTSLLAIQGRDMDALAADYDQVRPILRVRLMPDESMGGVPLPESVLRPVAPGILAVLVFDFPDSTATVAHNHLEGWPVDLDGAFEQALANLVLEPSPMHDDIEVEEGDGATIRAWYGDSFYVATRALRLRELVPEGTTDALVAVPNRHTLLVHPIVDGQAPAAMRTLYRMTVPLFRDGPGSISDQPYWWHDGTLVQIPHQDNGSRVAVAPPDGFLAVLAAALARSAAD